MKTTLHRIITKDNLELVGLLYEPEQATDKILVHVHGMAGNFYENTFLDFIAETLTKNGIAFFAFNNRGCEMVKDLFQIKERRILVQIGDAYEKFEDCLLDIKAAIDFAEGKGFSKIHLSGHSLGGPKAAYYVADTKDPRITSLIFLSPSDMVGLAKKKRNYEQIAELAKKMIAEGKGKELLPEEIFENHLSAETFISLTDENSKVAIFNFYNSNDTLFVLSKINIPALTIIGKKDGVLIIPIDEMMNRIKKAMLNSPKVQTEILGDARHDYFDYEQELADTINSWIQKLN